MELAKNSSNSGKLQLDDAFLKRESQGVTPGSVRQLLPKIKPRIRLDINSDISIQSGVLRAAPL